MSNPDDNARKPNGVGTDPMQRLASIKPPRDLSLGGPKPSKKVFTPNLNVARNKNKGPNLNTPHNQKKDGKNKRDRKNDKNRNVRNGPNIIKSTGVFSGLLGSVERHSSRVSYGRNTDSAPVLQKPTIRVKDVIKIDKELEEQRIRSAVSVSHGKLVDEEVEDFKISIDNEAPVKLPMDDIGWSNSQSKTKVKVEMVIKQEPEDSFNASTEIETKPLVSIKKEVFEDNDDVAKLLQTQDPTLILLKLPDTLPGRGGSADDDAPRRKHNGQTCTSSDQAQGEEQKKDTKCHLKDLEEGRIGKLRIHRSGRVTLWLGDTSFEVSLGTKSAFYQEVVSVAADDASRSANLVSLGPLQHKLTVVPDWETMFKDLPT